MTFNRRYFLIFTFTLVPLYWIAAMADNFILSLNFTANIAQATNNLNVSTASYLGSDADDFGTAVAISPDRTILFTGKIPHHNFGLTPVNLVGGGDGVILQTDATGRKLLSLTRMGRMIDDIEVNGRTGKIAVVGDFGLALLGDAQTLLWHQELGSGGSATMSNGRRVAMGTDGKIAALFNKKITIFDEMGTVVSEFTIPGKFVEDVAIHSSSQSIIITGYTQKDRGGCRQLQVAFIRSYDYQGNLNWTNYDWTHGEAHRGNSSCADTRGSRLTLGLDGNLYFAGESAGGNTIFRYDPRDLSKDAPNVIFDPYNHPYNTASNHITYYARFDPVTGEIHAGQFNLSRLSNGRGNTIIPRAIAADEGGNLYIGGKSSASFANRNESTISGQSGAYAAADNFVLAVPSDLRTRTFMVSWNKGCKGNNQVVGIATGYGITAMISDTAGCDMITVNPLQGKPQGGMEILYSVWEN
ncbi:SBBP repeat-containing protein [Laspinema palackyanum]|uniref:SBBP repeat-containing protein n=1 Tax=Laspinema palackyanum TaxID=3231601 RepID=UPI00345CB57F|nr:SBBP repeat-containing protein [Laspinema sp. D2c]